MNFRNARGYAVAILSALALLCGAIGVSSAQQPPEDGPSLINKAKELLRRSREAFAAVDSYTAVIVCQDRIDGKLLPKEYIETSFKKPNSIYVHWLPGPYEGLQASYAPARDGAGHFKALETGLRGLLGVMNWEHESSIINALYPHHFRTHQTSLQYLLQLTSEIFSKGEKIGKLQITEVAEITDSFTGRKATKIEAKLSDNPADGLMWSKTIMFIDSATGLPLHFILYDFGGGLFGEYAFTKFRANVAVNADIFELKKL